MHLPLRSYAARILLERVGHFLVIYDYSLSFRNRLLDKVYNIQQFAGVTTGISEQELFLSGYRIYA